MPTERIGPPPESRVYGHRDPNIVKCRNPDHHPPSMQAFRPGRYKHTCPGCGHVRFFVVHPGIMTANA